MRIGILTYWTSENNYGQLLQCYALQRYLRDCGHDAYLIKYKPKKNVSVIKRIKRKIKFFLSAKIRSEIKLIKVEKERDKQRKFNSFREEKLISTDIEYNSIEDLKSNPPQADIYICGSDQVWHDSLFEMNIGGWFCDFGSAVRISYAASIGREYSKEEEGIFSSYLSTFSGISVREESALLLCRKLGFKNAEVTIDPTLLLTYNDYNKMIASEVNIMKGKIFVYVVNIENINELHWDEIQEYANNIGCETEICCSSGYIRSRELVDNKENIYPTIEQWLASIRNSTSVITSSFHGTVFCLIMHKPFVCLPLENKFKKANDRILNLLEMVGLKERIYNTQMSISNQMSLPINWKVVDDRLEEHIEKSKNFINKHIGIGIDCNVVETK